MYKEINIKSSTNDAWVKYRTLVPVPYQKTDTLVMKNSALLLLLLVVVVGVVVVATIETITEKKACHL